MKAQCHKFESGNTQNGKVFKGLLRIRNSRNEVFICLLLALGTITVFWPVRNHGFIACDDLQYITSKPQVVGGLNWENMRWAFRSHPDDYWRPLTLLSFMLDCQLFGLNAGAHHLSSVALHLLNTLLLFLVFYRITGALWRSSCLAALFAWHPLHVEPVAWAADRGDVLAGCFWMLTLWAYARYAQNSVFKVHASRHPPSSVFYLLSLFFFALGLLSKPTLVTLPFVLLLVDYWPLTRFQLSAFNFQLSLRLLWEKLPFLALSGISSYITYLGQLRGGGIAMNEKLDFSLRLGNALVSFTRYLGKTFWPTHLAIFYPHPGAWPRWQTISAGILLIAVSLFVVRWFHRRPYLLVGWLWFLGTLVPVIGLIQVGDHSRADRYTYIPLIGMFILVIWGAYELTRRWRYHSLALSVAGSAAIVLCLVLTRQQLGHWKDGETLFRHALAVVPPSVLAHYHVGAALLERHEFAEAKFHFEACLKLRPNEPAALSDLGMVLVEQGMLDEGLQRFQEALKYDHGRAVRHYNLGLALAKANRPIEAVACYRQTIWLQPDHVDALNNLAWLRATCRDPAIRDGAEAVHLAERVVELTKRMDAENMDTLAAAYAEAGRFVEAVVTAKKAAGLADSSANIKLARDIETRLRLYEEGKPFRENLPREAAR